VTPVVPAAPVAPAPTGGGTPPLLYTPIASTVSLDNPLASPKKESKGQKAKAAKKGKKGKKSQKGKSKKGKSKKK
jgi:hypothetical protein